MIDDRTGDAATEQAVNEDIVGIPSLPAIPDVSLTPDELADGTIARVELRKQTQAAIRNAELDLDRARRALDTAEMKLQAAEGRQREIEDSDSRLAESHIARLKAVVVDAEEGVRRARETLAEARADAEQARIPGFEDVGAALAAIRQAHEKLDRFSAAVALWKVSLVRVAECESGIQASQRELEAKRDDLGDHKASLATAKRAMKEKMSAQAEMVKAAAQELEDCRSAVKAIEDRLVSLRKEVMPA